LVDAAAAARRAALAVSLVPLALPLLLLPACGLKPAPRPPAALYDLGSLQSGTSSAPRITQVVVVHEPIAPPWLDSRDMHYRLAYDEPARLRRYGSSRWALSPPQIFGTLLRTRLAEATEKGAAIRDFGLEADYRLLVELEEFNQVFDSEQQGRAVVRLKVALNERRVRRLLAQRTFSAEAPCPSPNAQGGVTALREASERAVAEIVDWVAKMVAEATPAARSSP
jgi:cholesterol transport system auxiliary component